MRVVRTTTLASIVLLFAQLAVAQRPASSASMVLDTAIARMGGSDAMRAVQRARFEFMTQWLRTTLDARPFGDQPTYEWHSDLRDYSIGAWRNTRRFNTGAAWREITDVVRDSVAMRRMVAAPGVAQASATRANEWGPLNIAYIDERDEAFAMAPERLLLAAREAKDLRALGDTTIAGAPHARVSATVGRYAVTIVVRRSTGMLTFARYLTAEPNDFGLVPWGAMDVETWYSVWRKQPGGLVYPTQLDERRVGTLYKRMTVLGVAFNPAATPDSFFVSDSLRAAYLATARKPMHDLPLDSARVIDSRFISFGTPGAPAGAVRLGRQWVLLEGGQAPLSAERAVGWLDRAGGGGRVAMALLTMPSPGNGGAAWLSSHGVPLHAGSGSMSYVSAVLRGHEMGAERVVNEARGRWLRVDSDSLWLEPMDLPDAPGALIAYVPSLEWVYTGSANPLHLDLVVAHVRARGWRVTRAGSPRGVSGPALP